MKWQPLFDHHFEQTDMKRPEWFLMIRAAFEVAVIAEDFFLILSCQIWPREKEMRSRGLCIPHYGSYKTFISATRPNSLLRWVLDIRDQCFLAHVITHSALSAILALCCSEKYFIWTSKTVSSNPTPTSTGLHLVTITKLPSETQRPLTIHSKKDCGRHMIAIHQLHEPCC